MVNLNSIINPIIIIFVILIIIILPFLAYYSYKFYQSYTYYQKNKKFIDTLIPCTVCGLSCLSNPNCPQCTNPSKN